MPRRAPKYEPEALRQNIQRLESSIQAFLKKIQSLQKAKTTHRESIKKIEDNIGGLLEGVENLRKEKRGLEGLLAKVVRARK